MANMLYNGIKLPALPDSTLTYKVIVYCSSTSEYWFVPTATAYTAQDNGVMDGVRGDEGYLYDANTDSWVSGKISTLLTSFVKWANYDVYTTDGTIYLSATDPIPVGKPITDPVSFMMGFQIGCRLRAQRAVKKPIGYLYNGVQLPELPQVDGKTKAYLYKVTAIGITRYKVVLISEPYYAISSNGSYSIGHRPGDVEYFAKESALEWNQSVIWEANGLDVATDNVLWANFDVIDENGEVVLAKSDPVPVYE